MKTPEEIKLGLEYCIEMTDCKECPYRTIPSCGNERDRDTLAYIRQLEREKAKLLEDMLIGPCCYTCKHVKQYRNVEPCTTCFEVSLGSNTLNWEWRGVEEDDHATD